MKRLSAAATRRAAGACTALIGFAVLVGWAFDIVFLKHISADFVSMKANTAICFLFLGAGLWLLPVEIPNPRRALLAKICAWTAVAIAGVTVAEFFLSVDFGLNELIFRDPLPTGSPDKPGHMVPATGIGICMLGSAVLLSLRGQDEDHYAAQILAGAAASVALVALLAYAYGDKLYFGVGLWVRMAMHTAWAILLSSLAVFLIRPDRGITAIVSDERMGGQMVRSVLPLLVLLPMSLAAVLLKAVAAGFIGLAFGAALVVSSFIVIVVVFVVFTAASMNRLDGERREGDKRYRSILGNSVEGICVADRAGRVLEANEAYCRMMGYSEEEARRLALPDFVVGETPAEIAEHLKRIQNFGAECFEISFRRKSGEVFPVEVSVRMLDNESGLSIGFIRDISARKKAEQDLKRLTAALDQVGESIVITDVKGNMIYANPAAEKASGYGRDELIGQNPRIFKSGKHDAAFYAKLWRTISSGGTWSGRLINKRKDGSLYTEEATIGPVRDGSGKISNYVAVKRDISKYILVEEELFQAQKMESVGRLAGGVAHDFNNILTAINGFAGFALEGLREGEAAREDIKEVLNSTARAGRLTKQLLAFSRRQVLNPEVLDLNMAVSETAAMLKRLIGEDIVLETRLARGACRVKLDRGQIEQVFMNLAVNARDAMPKGGTLSFETAIELGEGSSGSDARAVLTVRDTGCGMSEEVRKKIFEPFYTTKEQGKGTGLGLAMVYGIVKQSGGDIQVESVPGCGTLFRIKFPLSGADAKQEAGTPEAGSVQGGSETVLLVEDEEALRRMCVRGLEAAGYSVLSAGSGLEALAIMQKRGKPADILVTDVILPGMNGRELAGLLQAQRLVGPTLFVSGFDGGALGDSGVLDAGLVLLPKPFTLNALLKKIRDILDARPGSGS